MGFKAFLCLCAIAILNSQPIVYATDSSLDKIKTKGYLTVGCKQDCPPFGFNKKGDIVGFDVDICRYIAEKLGVKLKVVPVASDMRVKAITDGLIDIAASTLTHTKERDSLIDFSIHYFRDGQKLLVRRSSGMKSYSDLTDKSISVPRGTATENRIKEVQPDAKIVEFDSYRDCFLALKQGIVDAFTSDSMILLGLKSQDDNPQDYEITGEFLSDEPYGLGIIHNDSRWRDFVNECLIEMWNSGEWLRIYNRWFGPGTKYEYSFEQLDFEMCTWPLQ
ncbi:MAG: ABC transporter substrate-binding protein [Candidatus Omnitrophota bacterium]|nr:ABC transporter substrate-binding protein [Candidatus Omnitrophota bacterium]MBU1928440.1 ABC transporter substrate-binding protein [Candidatus Omnitrophota bacterium]MBU2034405.1 ABC transporter substrate-binding protein [Candidatus Omnitrophota bacterium]MBU2221802.1 ABC transporter substrate-binding protein [Candidatus Omnitrophota bacterium]MBU2258234.1 ABC transporter substrate-binding protein [Candidatus Omnitrophota bacterium]